MDERHAKYYQNEDGDEDLEAQDQDQSVLDSDEDQGQNEGHDLQDNGVCFPSL